MNTKLKKVYYCEFCKKHSLTSRSMMRHEEFCTSNPKNFVKCSGCKFIKEEKIEYYFDTYLGESSGTSTTFRCTKLDKLMYPMKAVKLGLLDKYPEQFEDQAQMLKECDSYEQTDHI